MIKVIICGAKGRMGERLVDLAIQDEELKFAGAIEAGNHSLLGTKITEEVSLTGNLKSIIKNGEVVIDFTNPKSSIDHARIAAAEGKKMVIGTTGFSSEQLEELKGIIKDIPCVLAPNMSKGVNLLFRLVGEVAKVLNNYDIEILEIHHNKKKDAPSGTANRIAEVVARVLERDINKVKVCGREGVIGARKKEEIGVHAVRAGDVVGEHTVFFAGPGERIELVHRAHSRDAFASGALFAAKWLIDKPKGLYNMEDVLDLK
ncbi:4-hydroxy-tetrahydrodipicolinate reductase [bacterium]|nr:4-hydroxy-tetrahydrodipicolinate reductase [bacterium]